MLIRIQYAFRSPPRHPSSHIDFSRFRRLTCDPWLAHSGCCSARKLDADRRVKALNSLDSEGSNKDAEQHFTHYCTTTRRGRFRLGRKTGQQDPGAHRRGTPQALAPRHLGSRCVAWAGLPRLALLLCRPRVGPVRPCVPPQAATPMDARIAPAVPERPLRLEAAGARDRNPVAARLHPSPVAGPAVCRQSPEVGAGWLRDHVQICAGGAQ